MFYLLLGVGMGTLKSNQYPSFNRGIIASAEFLITEFEGDEKALDFAKCLIGELVRLEGEEIVELFSFTQIKKFQSIIREIIKQENDDH